MDGFKTTEAVFGTRYGSIDTVFKNPDDEDYVRTPKGIAHFLEHKLFEDKDKNAFELYAKTGASANAYTSFDRTCYTFSCSENYLESLEVLLSFVQNPYFTKESVEEELEIIRQEINMCNDNPSWKVFFNMLKNMYRYNTIKEDIAGTYESISSITASDLYSNENVR
jgi:predicted Zn-dependent peptidase